MYAYVHVCIYILIRCTCVCGEGCVHVYGGQRLTLDVLLNSLTLTYWGNASIFWPKSSWLQLVLLASFFQGTLYLHLSAPPHLPSTYKGRMDLQASPHGSMAAFYFYLLSHLLVQDMKILTLSCTPGYRSAEQWVPSLFYKDQRLHGTYLYNLLCTWIALCQSRTS